MASANIIMSMFKITLSL